MEPFMGNLLIKNPAAIISPRPGLIRGKGFGDLHVRKGASILIRNGRFEAIGAPAGLERIAVRDGIAILDATGRAVIPGFVDCHSHPLFAGSRASEFAQRIGGLDYQTIASRGGGIMATVQATRACSVKELKEIGQYYLALALRQGITSMEVKSGYGLDPETELKILATIRDLNNEQPIELVPTFLGAHAVPKGVSKEAYLQQLKEMIPEAARLARFCDVFCEQGYFSPEESAEILNIARSYGMLSRLHANQFHGIGCIDKAVELGAVSADHLEVLSEREIALLAGSDTACVILPGVSLFLDIPYAPARRLIDDGAITAIATDFNPGSNMTLSLQLMMSLACMKMHLSVDEALCCTTQNGAHVLGLASVGCIEEGWQADLLVLDSADYQDMVYFYGENHIRQVIKKGVIV
jgi:imidazolonepropionase